MYPQQNGSNYGNYFQGFASSAYVASGNAAGNNANNLQANPSGTVADKSGSEVQKAAEVGNSGNPMVWWVIMLGLLFGVTFVIEKFNTAATFGNIKLSAYNALIIGLYAVLFISVSKVFFTKVKIPGLSAVFLAI